MMILSFPWEASGKGAAEHTGDGVLYFTIFCGMENPLSRISWILRPIVADDVDDETEEL